MKAGFNLLLWTGNVTEEHLPLIEQLASWGVEGLEFPIFDPNGSPWEKLAAKLKELNLGSTAVAVMPEGTSLISEDAAQRKAGVEHLKRVTDAAAKLGADNICGPIYNPVGALIGRGPNADEKSRCVDCLREAGEYAAQAQIDLVVEPLNRFETFFLNTQADTVALLERIGLDNLGSLYDTFHANIEETDIVEAIRTGGKWIKHVHTCANHRGTPGDDHIPWTDTFNTLQEIGYDGWLTIESFGHRIPELAGATCIWRQVAPSEEHVVKEGTRHIRNVWKACKA
ncbi:MAG: sugar phosphate isomerase/epimerase [Candidatus Hydrogenedentes bacterium]|nr:sugar phosphate isomerase/epimerase [Candidatus Hydrogenedentota bacterium]